MHTEDTALAGTGPRTSGTPTLTAIVPLARPETAPLPGARPAGNTFDLAVAGGGADERALSVRYELDVVTHRWIASIMDDRTGEVVQTVPSTRVLHQLAALRRPVLDVHA